MVDSKKFGTGVRLVEQKATDFSSESLAEGWSYVDGKSDSSVLESLLELTSGMSMKRCDVYQRRRLNKSTTAFQAIP